jgi:hypothetical protein
MWLPLRERRRGVAGREAACRSDRHRGWPAISAANPNLPPTSLPPDPRLHGRKRAVMVRSNVGAVRSRAPVVSTATCSRTTPCRATQISPDLLRDWSLFGVLLD